MIREVKRMKCPVCEQEGASIRRSARTYGAGDNLFVIENVPAISCPNCGSVTYEAATVKMLDVIKRERQQRAVKREVEVAVFPNEVEVVVTPDHHHAL